MGWRSPWCPAFLTEISAVGSTRPVLTEHCSWFFLSKYLQYGQSLLLKNWRPLLSHVASRRPGRGYFFICLTTHLTRLVPEGMAAAMAAGLPAGMCLGGFPDSCEEE